MSAFSPDAGRVQEAERVPSAQHSTDPKGEDGGGASEFVDKSAVGPRVGDGIGGGGEFEWVEAAAVLVVAVVDADLGITSGL